MNSNHSIRVAGLEDLPAIASLAGEIWRSHYPGIIPAEQIEYMLGRMYSMDQMQEEILHQGVVYFLCSSGGIATGFAAVGPAPQPAEFKLHKLYVLPAHQRAGQGRALLQAACGHALSLGGGRLVLAVNKNNRGALAAYGRYGFRNRESVRVDIGGGFFMDDYILELPLFFQNS